ncbi:MAG: hypothetical protein WBV82_07180 [Myxococcaceae bacterium]
MSDESFENLEFDIEAADARTLRLAAPLVTPERLAGYIRYLESFHAQLHATSIRGTGDAAHVADSHRRAQADSGVDLECFGPLSALVADFAAKRGTVQALRRRLDELGEREGDMGLREREEAIRKELVRLDSLAPLERRYGAVAIALLMAHEALLIRLQSEVSRVLAGHS